MKNKEKKIIFSEVEPSTETLWLHNKNGNLILEAFGSNGWQTVAGNSSAGVFKCLRSFVGEEPPTTIEELATFGITKEVITDMANGKYAFIDESQEGIFPITNVYASKEDDFYSLYFGQNNMGTALDNAFIMKITINGNEVECTEIYI